MTLVRVVCRSFGPAFQLNVESQRIEMGKPELQPRLPVPRPSMLPAALCNHWETFMGRKGGGGGREGAGGWLTANKASSLATSLSSVLLVS